MTPYLCLLSTLPTAITGGPHGGGTPRSITSYSVSSTCIDVIFVYQQPPFLIHVCHERAARSERLSELRVTWALGLLTLTRTLIGVLPPGGEWIGPYGWIATRCMDSRINIWVVWVAPSRN